VQSHGASSASLTGFVIIAALYAVLLAFVVWGYVRIIRRAGYSGWWVLIGLVPVANIVMFFIFAFRPWPVQRELEQLRAQVAGAHGAGGGPAGGYPGQAGRW
jgi:hypothetical protein